MYFRLTHGVFGWIESGMKHLTFLILLVTSLATFAEELPAYLKIAQEANARSAAILAAPAPTPNYQAQQLEELRKINASVKALQPLFLYQEPKTGSTVLLPR